MDALETTQTLTLVFRLAFIGMGFVLFWVLLRTYRSLYAILGTSVDRLHRAISQIGSGTSSDPITVNEGMEESVLGWLAETQHSLQTAVSGHERMAMLYRALSQCNETIIHSQTESELYWGICRDAVTYGGMKMAWIGIANSQNGRIEPVSFYGEGTECLTDYTLSIDPHDSTPIEPVSLAFRGEKPFWGQHFDIDMQGTSWHFHAVTYGWKAVAALPLRQNGKIVGVFNLCSDRSDAFDDTVQQLIEKMILNMDYALGHFEQEKVHKLSEDRIHRLANFDPLTELPNRILLEQRFEYVLSTSKRHKKTFALMFLDLDRFKEINDTLGHSIGDKLLIALAQRTTSVLRKQDTVSRMGGDEFTFILPETDHSGAQIVAYKLLELISHPFFIDGRELNVTASIGIALYPEDGEEIETLSKHADNAMYRAKEEGRNAFSFYTEEMQQISRRNLQISNAMHNALLNTQFQIVYQPQISAKTGHIIGAEALLRWQHPELGPIPPSEFIPIAERNGLILPIGEWILRTALNQLKTWIEGGMSPVIMAINLSAVQFRDPKLPEMIHAVLNDTQLSPEYLELELTESVAMRNPSRVISIMNNLHKSGIRMSIDDFGTGYSSLSYLKQFKVYKLKIDQSFVRNITIDAEDKTIVNTIIQMAHNLGLRTIAEGVETKEQLNYLRECGCDEIQGYYYSKPLPPDEFERMRRSEDYLEQDLWIPSI